MKIKNTRDEIIISIPIGTLDQNEIQNLLDFIRYKTLVTESKANDKEINAIVEEINTDMRKANQSLLNSIL